MSFRDTSAFHVSNLGHVDWSEPRPLQIGQRCPTQIEPRAALMLDLPKGIGGVVTSSPVGSGALLFW